MTRPAQEAFVPNKAMVLMSEASATEQSARVPWLQGKRVLRGKPTAYVCERGRCELPTSDPKVFGRQLAKRTPYPSFEARPVPKLPIQGAAR